MTPAPEVISCEGTAADAIHVMRAKRIRSLIVDRDDETDAYGIVTYNDLVNKVFAKKLDPAKVPICRNRHQAAHRHQPQPARGVRGAAVRQDGHQPRAGLFRAQAHRRDLQDRSGGELVLALIDPKGPIDPSGILVRKADSEGDICHCGIRLCLCYTHRYKRPPGRNEEIHES